MLLGVWGYKLAFAQVKYMYSFPLSYTWCFSFIPKGEHLRGVQAGYDSVANSLL